MHLVLVGLSHHIAPIAVRERLNCSETQLPHALLAAAERPGVQEVAILSTCNRMEVYALVDAPHLTSAYDRIIQHLSDQHHVPEADLRPFLYSLHDQEMVLHMMRVAAGLDSLVLGEAQILGQVKGALRAAQTAGTVGGTLTGILQQAISAGRRTQAETGLGRGAFSIGHAAVDLAMKVFGELSHAGILILGAGKMSEVTARHLRNSGASAVLVANRTYARAEALATKLGGRAIQYDAFPDELSRADIVIASTAAPHPIINRATLAPIMRKRRGNPLILIDIAVPRDIDEDVKRLGDNVFLYNIDDLQEVVAQEAQGRKSEVGRAEAILTEECAKSMNWVRTREAAPVITLLRRKLDRIREEELSLLRSQLDSLTEREWQKVEAAFRSMSTKYAKEPILRLKRETAEVVQSGEDETQTYDLLTATREIFNLDAETETPGVSSAPDKEITTEELPLPIPVPAGRQEPVFGRREGES